MAEIADYVNRNAALITPATVEQVVRQLPIWKAGFTQIEAPNYPHLVSQLSFLADAVEDCAEGAYRELPYSAFAAAVFALVYAHKQADLIPDTQGEFGWADDSSVARAVLIQHESAFKRYAQDQGREWAKITTKP
jgi:uncharacterized membrane protein YkvA (DUF1232 family)